MPDIYKATRRSDGRDVDFPVTWEEPGDEKLLWRWASDHFPLPATPLAYDLVKDMVGMTRSYAHFGSRVRIRYTHHNGYGFGPLTLLPTEGESPDFEPAVSAQAPNVTKLWDETWWPQIERESRAVRGADYSSLSLPQLVETLKECHARYDDHYEYMMRASRLVRPPRTALVAFLSAHFEDDAEALATALLSGTSNISLEASGGLWEVAQTLRGRPELLSALSTSNEGAATPQLDEFWQRFNAWLDRYGHRNSTFEEIAEPTWADDPRVPLRIVRGHASGTPDPRTEQRRAISERDALQQALEARLAADEIPEFRRLVELALPYSSVRESRPYASNISRAALRWPAMALGSSLVSHGLVEAPDDVFFLHVTELEAAASSTAPSSLRQLVKDRREQYTFWRGVVPPLAIGAIENEPASTGWSGRGVAASAGVAQGRARVILDLKEADTFEPGEVLVTVSTSPLWTALFGLASAVVTDSGGMLSHPSIVAREHHLPAVVGVRGATQRIRTGDQLLVNGTDGTVEVLS
ncbi:MAG: PEP-utilizing enzyme [Dehalococcoidia bacterium]